MTFYFYLACKTENLPSEILAILLSNGADVNIKDKAGNTPLLNGILFKVTLVCYFSFVYKYSN